MKIDKLRYKEEIIIFFFLKSIFFWMKKKKRRGGNFNKIRNIGAYFIIALLFFKSKNYPPSHFIMKDD